MDLLSDLDKLSCDNFGEVLELEVLEFLEADEVVHRPLKRKKKLKKLDKKRKYDEVINSTKEDLILIQSDGAVLNLPPSFLKDSNNPLMKYPDEEFIKLFRLPKEKFLELFHSIFEKDDCRDFRGGRIPNYLALLASLRYYVSSVMKFEYGELGNYALHQSSVSRCVSKISKLIAGLQTDSIHLTQGDADENVRQFEGIARMPGVIGCLGCLHIKIQNPGGNDGPQFRNRKGSSSINVQAICNTNLEFTDFVGYWPGSTANSIIFSNSRILCDLKNNMYGNGHLIGDNSYVCSNNLLTPIRSPQNLAEERYNDSHAETLNCLDRTFELWKREFRCLQSVINTKLENTLYTLTACAVLHNMLRKVPYPPEFLDETLEIDDMGEGQSYPDIRNEKRDVIISHYFSK